MNKFFTTLLVLLISSACFAQHNKNSYLNGYIEHAETFKQTIPLIPNERDYPIIEVEINDKKYHFLFDTGAMASIISDKIADTEKINEENTINISAGTSTKKTTKQSEAPIITERIKINDISFNNISMAVIDLQELNKHLCTKIDGILGMNLIKLCNWKINTFEQTLTFSNQVFVESKQVQKIALKYHQGLLPLVKTTQGKNEFLALLDTGFDGTLQLYTDFKISKKMKSRKGEGYFMMTINQMTREKIEEITLDKLSLDDFEIQNVKAYVANNKPLLGMALLKDYTVFLNFTDNSLSLSPVLFQATMTIGDDFGAKFCINEKEELQVCFLWDNAQLKKEGIDIGDRIIAINHIPTDKFTSDTYCDFSKTLKENNTIFLTFKKGKEEKTIQLER